MSQKNNTVIDEAAIRQVIWMLKSNKTKKACCEHLKIPYNVKKLDNIIEEFYKREDKEKQLRLANRKKIFSEVEKQHIAKEYLKGASQASLAKDYYISVARIKKILIEAAVPIKGKGKNNKAAVEHITQDYNVNLEVGDKIFYSKYNCYGTITKIYDESLIEYLETGRPRYVEIYPFKPNPKTGLSGKFSMPKEGVHYEVYYTLLDGVEMKRSALINMREQVERNLIKTGKEMYEIWRSDESSCFYYAERENLYPVKVH